MDLDLDLNEAHQAAILNYMRFARYQRQQCLKTINSCFRDVKDTRLVEDTYTQDEVDELISYLIDTVNTEIESELLNASHTNVILLRQLFQQAEHWHLKLQADISGLENSELLNKIKLFEEQQILGTQYENTSSPVKTKLEPLNENGGSVLLQMKISQLEEENEQLRERLKQTETQAVLALKEKSVLSDEMKILQAEIQKKEREAVAGNMTDQDIDTLQMKVSELQTKLEETETVFHHQQAVEKDLMNTKHRLLELQAQVELTEKELEKKFSQTVAYINMKKILTKKNEQIKELRKRLAMFDPAATEGED